MPTTMVLPETIREEPLKNIQKTIIIICDTITTPVKLSIWLKTKYPSIKILMMTDQPELIQETHKRIGIIPAPFDIETIIKYIKNI